MGDHGQTRGTDLKSYKPSCSPSLNYKKTFLGTVTTYSTPVTFWNAWEPFQNGSTWVPSLVIVQALTIFCQEITVRA